MRFYGIERFTNGFRDLMFGISGMTGPVLGIIGYVLGALALYTMAERRGIRHSWMAWVPVLNVWLLGSLSDQYRYVVRGEIKSKRKVLLTLKILDFALGMVLVVLGSVMVVGFVMMPSHESTRVMNQLAGPGLAALGVGVVLLVLSIVTAVIEFMALYDIFQSCDPQNASLFLVLSIVIGVTRPLFLFVCRNKELGMPPRVTRPETTE